jgi:hypothetical protein
MSYHIDSNSSLLFDNLTDIEAETLQKEVEALVLKGTSVWGTAGFLAWCEAGGFNHDNALLVMATAYPQRALLSLLRRKQVQLDVALGPKW